MVVKRVNKKSKLPFKSRKRKATDFEVSLATDVSEPADKLGDYVIWLHGAPGVGKTSLAARFPKVHMFMAEVGGAKSQRTHQKPIRHFQEWVAYLDVLAKDKKFQTISVDVLERLYDLCFEYMCKEVMHIEHPQDENDFGKSWGKINSAFCASMAQAAALGKGLVLVSHSTEKPMKTFLGEEYELIRPNLSGRILETMKGSVDIIGYMYAEGRQRFMRIMDNGDVMAKVRPTERFLWTDGTPIDVIPLGTDADQAYENFVAAFNNELDPPKREPKKKKLLKRKK